MLCAILHRIRDQQNDFSFRSRKVACSQSVGCPSLPSPDFGSVPLRGTLRSTLKLNHPQSLSTAEVLRNSICIAKSLHVPNMGRRAGSGAYLTKSKQKQLASESKRDSKASEEADSEDAAEAAAIKVIRSSKESPIVIDVRKGGTSHNWLVFHDPAGRH